jgi:CheY-like chemotaxis protein
MSDPARTILLVEDNDDDVFVMRRALKQGGITNPLHVATDGQAALDYLSAAGDYADRARYPLPFIAFVDLKLPYVDGFEILSWIRRQPDLSELVVVMLTSSAEQRDQEKAYLSGARSYLVKPPTPETLADLMNSLESYWLAKRSSVPVSYAPHAAEHRSAAEVR